MRLIHASRTSDVEEQMDISTHFHTGFFTIPRYILAKKIAEIFPEKMNRVSFTIGGDASIEVVLKVAIINRPVLHNFISLYGGYHGSYFMAVGASHKGTMSTGRYFGGVKLSQYSQNFIRVPALYYYRPYFEVCNLDDKEEVDRRALEALEMQIKYGSIGPSLCTGYGTTSSKWRPNYIFKELLARSKRYMYKAQYNFNPGLHPDCIWKNG